MTVYDYASDSEPEPQHTQFELLYAQTIAISQHLETLQDQMDVLSSNFSQFMNQTRLLMGALIQNRSPETITNLLTRTTEPTESDQN